MIFFILEVSGGPGGAPGSKLQGDREKIMKCFTYLFDKMLGKLGPVSVDDCNGISLWAGQVSC